MPPDPISGRDVELIATGLFSLFAGGVWAVRPDGSVDAGPLVTFALLAVLIGVIVASRRIRSHGHVRAAWFSDENVRVTTITPMSFSLAWVDIRSRGGRSVSREE